MSRCRMLESWAKGKMLYLCYVLRVHKKQKSINYFQQCIIYFQLVRSANPFSYYNISTLFWPLDHFQEKSSRYSDHFNKSQEKSSSVSLYWYFKYSVLTTWPLSRKVNQPVKIIQVLFHTNQQVLKGVGCWMLDVWAKGKRCWMLDVGCWMYGQKGKGVGCWMLDVGCMGKRETLDQ